MATRSSPTPTITNDNMADPSERSVSEQKAIGAPPRPTKKYSYGFWDPALATQRGIYIKAMVMTVVLTVIVMWICLPVYWGSLAHQRSYSDKLKAWFINHDGSDIGNAIQSAVQASIDANTKAKLGWRIQTPSQFSSNKQVADLVVEEHAWIAVIVEAGATAALNSARENGDASYNASKAISIYYDQGRNELATNSFIIPYTQALLQEAFAEFSAKYAAQYLTAQSGNATALAALARAPQTIASPVFYTLNNLRPYDAPVATAILLVGSIYIIIFSFVITMTGYAVRAPLEPFLKTKQLLLFRIIAPPLMYIPLSFSYSMISLTFKVPFGAKYTHAGGFFVYWLYVYMTMCALGLATEAMVTLLTPKFMTFFLFPLIISNVSVASLPIILEPWFYKYGYGFPVYNMSQATRTLIFNTKSHLGLNAGVLISWIALSLCTVPLFAFLIRRKEQRTAAPQEQPLTPQNSQDVEERQDGEKKSA